MARALSSSALKTPAGGRSDCVVMNVRKPSGCDIRPPRSWPMTRSALALVETTCNSSISAPAGYAGQHVRIERFNLQRRPRFQPCNLLQVGLDLHHVAAPQSLVRGDHAFHLVERN